MVAILLVLVERVFLVSIMVHDLSSIEGGSVKASTRSDCKMASKEESVYEFADV